MRSKLVQVGNSKGIRLPKALIQAARLKDAVEISVEDGRIIISPVVRIRNPREGWEEAIRRDIELNGPVPVDSDWESMPNEWDDQEWTW